MNKKFLAEHIVLYKKGLISVILGVLLVGFSPVTLCENKVVQVTDNGNTLFYNYPAGILVKPEGFFISYVTKQGQVKVKHLTESGVFLKEYNVHDYQKKGDDHAAPAIIHDKNNNRLWLATSYHSSDLYI